MKPFILLAALLLPASTLPLPASQWQQLGMGAGGQILMLEGDPADPSTVYLGSDVAGLWRSEDSGASWQYLTGGWTPLECQSLAFDPADSQTLFVATSEGVLKSGDRGASWSLLASVTHPSALAATRDGDGHLVLYFSTGLTRSNSGGDGLFYRFNHAGSGLLESFPYAVSSAAAVATRVDPADSSHLWMSTGTGVFESRDAGATWQAVNAGLPSSACGQLLVDPADFDHLLVAVRGLSGASGGVYRKAAGASSWTSLSGNLTVAAVDWNALAVEPAAPFGSSIWAGSATAPHGIYHTANGLDASPLWIARQAITEQGWATGNPIQTNPATLVRLADGSLWTGKNGNFHQSTDGGLNWRQCYTTKVSTEAAVTAGPNQGRRRADNWTHRGVCNTVDNMVAVDPAHPERILIAVADRGIIASSDGGLSFHQYLFRFDTLVGNSAFLVAFDPADGSAYASFKDAFGALEGSKVTGLFKGVFQPASQDWHWQLLAGGDAALGGLPKEALPSGLAFSPDGSAMWLVARAFNSSTSADRGVWESRDGGVTWAQIGLGNRRMQCLAADPHNADALLIGVRAGGGGQGVWRGQRSGGAWTFTQTLGVTVPGNAVAEDCLGLAFDSSQPGLVHAAMGKAGFYTSSDGGLTWTVRPAFGASDTKVGARSVATTTPAGACIGSSGGTFTERARIRRTEDAGTFWLTLSPPFPESGYLGVFGPGDDRLLYAATRGMGTWRLPLNYAGWRRSQFSLAQQSDPSISGPLADPDFDTHCNALEYTLGTDPWRADPKPHLVPFVTAGRLAVDYEINPAATDARVHLENSGTLPFPEFSLPVQITSVGEDEPMRLRLRATDAAPAPHSPRFMRLRLELSPAASD